jgi:hypothetical protein
VTFHTNDDLRRGSFSHKIIPAWMEKIDDIDISGCCETNMYGEVIKIRI